MDNRIHLPIAVETDKGRRAGIVSRSAKDKNILGITGMENINHLADIACYP